MGLSNIRCIKRQKNKAGKGPKRAGWGGDLQEAAPTRECQACRGIQPCLPGAGVVQAGIWDPSDQRTGDPSVWSFSERGCFWPGRGLLPTAIVVHNSVVQILFTHPEAFFPMRSSFLVFWEQSGKQPLSAGRSAPPGSFCCPSALPGTAFHQKENILCYQDPGSWRTVSLCYCHQS